MYEFIPFCTFKGEVFFSHLKSLYDTVKFMWASLFGSLISSSNYNPASTQGKLPFKVNCNTYIYARKKNTYIFVVPLLCGNSEIGGQQSQI